MNCVVHNSQIADRLPFTGDTLVSSKIGKIVRKLAKDAPIPGECALLFKRYLSSCSAKLDFHVWIAVYAPIVIMHCLIFCKCSTKKGEEMSDHKNSCNIFYSGQGHGGES